MDRTIQQVMTPNPLTLTSRATLLEAAQVMRDEAVGAVIVKDDDAIRGIVTDRDIIVRGVAEGVDPEQGKLWEICSGDLITVSPSETINTAINLMRSHALRRLPVVDGTKPVGIVSLGDLAVEQDPESALAYVSAAAPNR